ncbi:hypothetical protein FGB62_333g03 [Gracilaria domingensis]|nr:hypothetical protein FGB62_333g03 [Gracilaria domingensis]
MRSWHIGAVGWVSDMGAKNGGRGGANGCGVIAAAGRGVNDSGGRLGALRALGKSEIRKRMLDEEIGSGVGLFADELEESNEE